LRTAYLLAHKAASAGHARAKFMVGMCYFGGWGVEVDEAAGKYWVEDAANQGESQAMYLVAGMIQEGRYPEKGMADVLYWLNRSADAGYAPAADALNEYKVQQVNGLIGALFLSAFSSGDSGSYEDTSSATDRMIERRQEDARYWTSRAESAAFRGDQAEYDYSRSKIP
jgi:TPR repeat protein